MPEDRDTPPALDDRTARLGREWFAQVRRAHTQVKTPRGRSGTDRSGDGDGLLDWLFGDGDTGDGDGGSE